MGGCFTTTKEDIGMKNITDGKPHQSQEMADGGQTRNKAASEIPRNTDSLNSSQGSVGVSNRSRGDGSRGHDIGTPSMDNAYRQWEKPTKSPQQAPVGVHVEDAPGNSRSRGDGSDGKDLNEKIQRFKDKHKVGTDGKTSKYTHRRSLSATTSSSEDSPGGRSLFRKRSSTFSIGDSKDSSRRRQTPNSTNMNNSAGSRGGARPFGILSVLKEMNETGSFSRPNSNSMGQLEGLPVVDKTTSELTYTTTTMSGILPANKPRSNSAAPALSTSGTTTTTTMGSSSSTSSATSSESSGSSTTTTPSTTTVTIISKNSTSKSSTPTPVVTPVQTVITSSTSSSISSTNVTVHQTSFPFTSPTTSTITTSSSFSVSNDGSAYTASSPSLSSSTTALLNPSPHSKPNSSTYEDSPTKGATEDRPLLIPSASEYEPRKSLLSGNRKTLAK